MEQSILQSTKKILGVDTEDDSFDLDIMTHINSAFSNLYDLGIGPVEGFAIEDDSTEWEEFFEGVENIVWMGKVKTVVYLRTRLLFDPPTTQYFLASLEKQIEQVEWRLNVNREDVAWVDPNPPPVIVVIVDEID